MKRILLLVLALASGLPARAVWFTSAPGSAASGSAYTVAAEESGSGGYTEVYLYKNGAFFAYGGGGGYAAAAGSSTDYGNQTITYEAYSSWYDDWWNYYGDYAAISVTITQTNNAPTITWAQNPASVPVNQWFAIQARGNDADGNLSNVFVWREWVPHAFNGGGNGYENYSDANGYGQSYAGTVTFMAQAKDSGDAYSPVIYHSVNIYVPNVSPTIAWVNNPAAAFVNQSFNVQSRANDGNGNLAWVNVWKDNQPFAFNGGGNGWEAYSDNNAAVAPTSGTITFKALAGDAAGAESGFIWHTVTINNRAPTMTPTVISGANIIWDATYQHYRMWPGSLTMSSTINDADGNLLNHTLRYRQVSVNPTKWYQMGGDAASGSTSTKQEPLNSVETPGEWDFNAFGHDGLISHPGQSKTVWVYGPTNTATFISQKIDNQSPTGAPLARSLNSGDLTATAEIKMKNTGDKLWEKNNATPHRLRAIGNDATHWGLITREMDSAQVDPEIFPGDNHTATFTFTFNIPQTPGPHVFQWKMIEEGVAGEPFFGAATPAVTITVIDTTPPTAPSALNATNLGTTAFRLNWTASIELGPVLTYDVFRTINGVTTFVGNTTNTFIDVAGLGSGLTYAVHVVAKDGATPVLTAQSQTLNVTTTFDPNADNDGDGVTNGVELALGLNPNDPTDVRVFNFTYDKINQLKTGLGGTYEKDAEGNIKKAGPQ